MTAILRLLLLAVVTTALFSGAASAEEANHIAEVDGVRVLHAWTRETDGDTALEFAEIQNTRSEPVTLTGLETDIAEMAQLVGLRLSGDGFEDVPGVTLDPGAELDLTPDGLAIRLDGLARPLKHETHFDARSLFGAESVAVEVEVLDSTATVHGHAGHGH